ncbi:(E)-4-hydroxy-3-methylbut-2-enyl-diphosphate synthase [Limisphaera ngatamarikiensis]|uniref:4-hydroxy-3-methylbut-2-en-1-yl diphosphate synthase (flavodoxin) n=1 Tax=Limisphaera ngatamarikiensis TaxID=1324935 RepID=A0A6M1REK9_9BACT|nr:(E)-4-hydroxy-3-methylbut-2-enyl-diphosphate synthase [Limisphaera ngatamarikiensis]NGO38016.1 (E)-4-hydroxy-3-methylbut-2-enyl-diphosphate synthase [Limisphaera ngatamarikiensis]
MRYCPSPYRYERRRTREIHLGDPLQGGVTIGGDHPVVVQSMITSDTMNTEACVREVLALVEAGCQVVRITAPTVKDAANLRNIVGELRARGCRVPIVADIHFKPEAAMEAVRWVECVRVNPGNFADSKKFIVREYTDEQYAAELARVEAKFTPLVLECKRLGRALRIGTNHGSLSDRILNRYGDTPLGMVESALEFARICRKHDFHNFKFSMKASNPKVAIQCYRLLVARLAQEGEDWNYPLHLGVTEAGDGEDGRIKSAIGIGSLLCDGLGDTIRVSLTEDAVHEIPVCKAILDCIPALTRPDLQVPTDEFPYSPFEYQRRPSREVPLPGGIRAGGDQPIRVVVPRAAWQILLPQIPARADVRPEAAYEDLAIAEVDPRQPFDLPDESQWVTVRDTPELPALAAFRLLAWRLRQMNRRNPILLKDCLQVPQPPLDPQTALLRSSIVLGGLLADGIGDAILVRNESDPRRALQLAFNILQAAGCRSFKTEYVACPSCGRTLFNLQTVTARIKARTSHLKGVKIAVMGCIVNGPGEMADADFGYVGGAPGKVNLYVGKKPVKFNIPEEEAVDRLIDLIREHGKWVDPEPNPAPEPAPPAPNPCSVSSAV